MDSHDLCVYGYLRGLPVDILGQMKIELNLIGFAIIYFLFTPEFKPTTGGCSNMIVVEYSI